MNTEISAYERAALDGDDPRCAPVLLDREIPVGDAILYPDYDEEAQTTWRLLHDRQVALLDGRACDEFLDGLRQTGFDSLRIPALRDVSTVLERSVAWRIARVPGLVHERQFFEQLSRRVFPSTDYLRPRRELDYTPAPDLFHDIFGHTPMITHPIFADFYQRIGLAALAARGDDRRRLERFYWFTVEFGLIETCGELRIYGNGILSSYEEVRHSLTDAVEKRPFDPAVLTEQNYDVWHVQPLLFVIESFEQLADGFDSWARGRGLL